MDEIKKSLYSTEEMLDRFRKEAEQMLTQTPDKNNLNLSQEDIKELLHQIQVQHIELEMQNDELKLANEEVESQHQKFSGLYDLAPVGYFIVDRRGVVYEANTTGCALLETGKRSILNCRFQSFIDPEDGELFFAFLSRTIKSKTRQSCQLTLRTSKKNTLYAQIIGIGVRNDLTQQEQCYIAVVDITEGRQAAVKQTETNERLKMALDASVAGTWQIDLLTRDISMDEFSCTIYGFPNCDAIQTIEAFMEMIHPDDQENASKRFGDAISKGYDLDVEYRIVKPDKNVAYVSARGHVVETVTTTTRFVGILIDITDRMLLEEEALRLTEEHHKNILTTIFQTQENERRRISEALHDSVSQLLYGIKLKLEDYKKSDKDSQIYSELNALIAQAVDETRDISFQLAPSILTDFGLSTTLEEMAKRISTDTLKIHTNVSGLKDRFELGKELSIFRIIQELVNNALKHANATQITIELIKKNKTLNITVSDNGIGFHVINNVTASGSGLHSIKNRLDLLEGIMSIQSTEGSGTTVAITFKSLV